MSNLQSETSRTNGAKSKGPTSPEGKARSSGNATKHGLRAKSIILPNEDPEAFQELLEAHLDQLQPETPLEYELVHTMTIARWRFRRLTNFETHLYEVTLDGNEDYFKDYRPNLSLDAKIAHGFMQQANDGHSIAMMLRYEATVNRTFDRAFKQLQTMQADRKKRTNEPKPAPPRPFRYPPHHPKSSPHLPPNCKFPVQSGAGPQACSGPPGPLARKSPNEPSPIPSIHRDIVS